MSSFRNYISQTQINTLLGCPARYEFKYIQRNQATNPVDATGLIVGQIVHKLVENNFDKTLTEIIFSQVFSGIGNNFFMLGDEMYTKENYQKLREVKIQGVPFLEFIFQVAKVFRQEIPIMGVSEKEVVIKDDEDIKIIMDFYDESSHTIFDFKTGQRSWNISELPKVQDLLYSYVLWKETGAIPRFIYLVAIYSFKTGKIKLQKFKIQHTEVALMEFGKEIKKIFAIKKQKIFLKNSSNWLCNEKFCEFYNYCQQSVKNISIEEMS